MNVFSCESRSGIEGQRKAPYSKVCFANKRFLQLSFLVWAASSCYHLLFLKISGKIKRLNLRDQGEK